MSQENWMKDPAVSKIAPEKLDFLQKMVFESKKLSKKELMPFFMSLASKGKTNNITFTDEEMNIIVETLKKYSTPEELTKINQIMNMKKQHR